jgi:integrase
MARAVKKERGVFERPKKSGIWWICYFDQFGMKHREKVGMRAAAIQVYQRRKTEIRQGKFEPEDIKRKHKNATVGEVIADYLRACEANGRKSLCDIKQRSNWWKDRLGERAAKSIIGDDIESARLELTRRRLVGHQHKAGHEGKSRSVATVNRYLATFKSAILMAISNEKLERNPFRKVKLQKENNARVRFLTADEERRLLEAIPSAWKTLVVVALHTGLRFSEQMHLQWEDIDLSQRLLTVRDSKAGKPRHIPLNQVCLETLQSVPRRINCPWVFHTDDGSRRTQLPRQWEEWIAEAGIENFHWHDLRHTFASRLVIGGVDLYSVKELLGHHSIEMTQRYAHLTPNHLKQAVEVLISRDEVTPELTPTAISA